MLWMTGIVCAGMFRARTASAYWAAAAGSAR